MGFTDSPKVQVGCFVVTKKGDKQRLIIDARRTNAIFRQPPRTLLGSVECWGQVEARSRPIFIAQKDVKDYFYHLGISKELGEYFALLEVDVGLLEKEMGHLPPEVRGLGDAGRAVFPFLTSANGFLMGFSSSPWLFRMFLLRWTGRPPPVIGAEAMSRTAMIVYADNIYHLGVSSKAVDEDQKVMRARLHSCGLDTHDIAAMASGKGPGEEASNIRCRAAGSPGHITMRCMLNRALLCTEFGFGRVWPGNKF